MEKIEVAVRLRPLMCNPAENYNNNNSIYGENGSNYFDNIHSQETVDEIWRIEKDSKTLRYIPPVSALESVNGKGTHHSHNKSFGNNGPSSGCMSR